LEKYNKNGEKMENDRVNVNIEDFGKTEGLIVLPYISDANQRLLIGIYLNELFSKDNDTENYNLINAKNSLLLSMLELCTNLKLVDEKGETPVPLFSINDVFYNIKTVKQWFHKIRNYDDFLERLYATIEQVREQKRLETSLGYVISDVYTKASKLIDTFLDMDLSDEKLENVRVLLREVNDSPILKESLNLFKNQNTATPE
jgi:hypothetical protein